MKRDQETINKRHEQLIELLNERKEMKVDEIAQIFNTSLMTTRRDLQALEEKGYLERFHGGCRIKKKSRSAQGQEIMECRDRISRYAASLVNDGDSLFINGSMTASGILEYLCARQITVITNNAFAAGYIQKEDIDMYLTGGQLKSHIMVGDYCLRNLLSSYVKKAFLGCTGISSNGEILCDIPSELGINETMISHAEEYYILADHTKIGKSMSAGSFSLQQKGTLITDTKADQTILQVLEQKGMRVILVDPEKNS